MVNARQVFVACAFKRIGGTNMTAYTGRAFCFSLAAMIMPSVCVAQTSPTSPRPAAEIERQMAELQKELAASKLAEANAAIAAETAAKAKADQARIYLASISGAPPTQPGVTAPAALIQQSQPSPGTVTTTTEKPDGTKVVEVKPWTQEGIRANTTGKQTFGGINFGVGVAFSYDLGSNGRVSDASVVDGIVRVNRTENVRARFVLESHFLFTPTNIGGVKRFFGFENTATEKNWGVGPFIALQPGGAEAIIDAIGAGVMVGLRRSGTGTDSFNIGVGVLYDLNVQTLGDGILENMPLPGLEEEVRFKRQEQSGLLIMSSYSF